MSIHVTQLEESGVEAWEAYVDRHPCGTFFHTLTWRDAIVDAFDHAGHYLMAWRDDRLVGVFPLMCISGYLAGRILVSVPYAVYGGTLADDHEVHEALLRKATRLAEHTQARWLDIRSIEPQWPHLPVVRRYVTFRKHLPDDPQRVLQEMPRKARAAARQARQRYRLEVVFGDEHLDTVWSLYSRSMRRLASLNYPSRFFDALLERTRPAERRDAARAEHLVQLVLHRGTPVAGLISFRYRDTLLPYFSGYDEAFARMHPNNLLYLAAMERGVELGCGQFDFGRTRVDNKGAYDFKRFQGFEPTPLHYQYYVPTGGREPDLTPSNPRLALARRVWPRLPLAVTRPLGAWLAKSIPG